MIIFKTVKDLPVALWPSNVVAVEQHPDDENVSVITHILNRNAKKTNILMVKHSVQEVVEAVNKVNSWL
jgi:hypothetical protein